MKKRMILSITLIIIAFIIGLASKTLATDQNLNNEGENVGNYMEDTNKVESNRQEPEANTTPTDYINDLNNQLQNIASKQQPKDMRRQVAVTVIIIITVLLIVGLVTWYYMTNQ